MKLRKLYQGYWLKTVLGAFTKFLEAGFELLIPLLMAVLIDQGIENGDTSQIIKMSIYILVLTLAGYGFSILCQYLASIVGQGFGGKLRNELFKKINTFSFTEYNIYSSATLTNRMTTDINQIQWGIAMAIRQATRGPILMVGSIVMTFIINPTIGLIMLVSLPFFAVILIVIMRSSAKIYLNSQSKTDDIIRISGENLKGSRMIRAFSSEEFETQRFMKANNEVSAVQKRLARVTSLSNPITSVVMNLLLVVFIYLGARFVNIGTMSRGEVISIVSYCTQMLLALIVFMNMVLVYSKAFTSSRRVREIMNVDVTIKSDESEVQVIDEQLDLEFENVSYQYLNSKTSSVSNINLKIPFGKTVGVIGMTGSGKTTLLNLIPRYSEATKGQVLVNGRNVKNYELKSLRDSVGYVSQTPALLTGTIRSNITMGRDYSDEEIISALYNAQASDIISGKQLGIDEPVLNRGANYSGGQKQRIALARALIKKPKILLLDDTFSALDYLTDKLLRKALKKDQSRTVIIISQRISTIMDADEIIVIEQGRIIGQGTHDILLRNCELYHNIYLTQEGGG